MKLYAIALAAVLPCLAVGPEIDRAKCLGSPSAPVTLEVFSDFTCPHCRVFHETTLPMLMKDYVVAGKVYVVDRAFPLTGQGHEHSLEAFTYGIAAARIGKYSAVADALYANQATWAVNGKVWETVAAVLTPAEQKEVQAKAKDPGVVAEMQREYQEGVASGVNSTPTLVLTHGSTRLPIPSPIQYVYLKSLIDGYTK